MALDETIDSIREHPLIKLSKYTHPGIVAVVSIYVQAYNLGMHIVGRHCWEILRLRMSCA